MNQKNKEYLLQLSRRTLEKYFQNKEILMIEEDELENSLKERKGVFVTLWKNQSLRGCIGSLEETKPIFEGVVENTLASALYDPRFPPLSKEELKDVKIEISIIEPLKKLPDFKKEEDLLNYLEKNKPGLLIKKGAFQATFLPQVWEELKDPELFLSRLCQKAGLAPDEWKNKDLKMYEYEADVFKE
ncbi:MAG: AmmeMemoRadiSam system protein A [Candidatus Pacebacteria bacterium]|nr:AmmeMemoRadiSam system protein A [Candidatus Paceibacterota bacterium]